MLITVPLAALSLAVGAANGTAHPSRPPAMAATGMGLLWYLVALGLSLVPARADTVKSRASRVMAPVLVLLGAALLLSERILDCDPLSPMQIALACLVAVEPLETVWHAFLRDRLLRNHGVTPMPPREYAAAITAHALFSLFLLPACYVAFSSQMPSVPGENLAAFFGPAIVAVVSALGAVAVESTVALMFFVGSPSLPAFWALVLLYQSNHLGQAQGGPDCRASELLWLWFGCSAFNVILGVCAINAVFVEDDDELDGPQVMTRPARGSSL